MMLRNPWLCWWLWCTVLFVFLVAAVKQHYQTGLKMIVSPVYYDSEMKDNEILRDGRLLNEEEEEEEKQQSPCVDVQDSPDNGKPTTRNCTSVMIEDEHWQAMHEKIVEAARHAAQRDLDVVMLGDSITKHWNDHWAFQRYFNKTTSSSSHQQHDDVDDDNNKNATSSSSLQGLALGVGGDTTCQLLWHLKHGVLESSIKPKVWLILIGTNNLGLCSKQYTLAGILQVAQYLQEHRPNTPIILHGLLPRGSSKDYTLNKAWDQIVWINQELKDYCDLHQDFYYVDSSDVFLKAAMTTTTLPSLSSSSNSSSSSSSTTEWIIGRCATPDGKGLREMGTQNCRASPNDYWSGSGEPSRATVLILCFKCIFFGCVDAFVET